MARIRSGCREPSSRNRLIVAAAWKQGDDIGTATTSSETESISVAVMSPTCVAREALCALLERDASIAVTLQGDTGPSSITSLRNSTANVILVDGSCRDCLKAIAELREAVPDASLVVYGVPPTREVLLWCARSGATLVASQDAGASTLVEMIKNAGTGRLSGQVCLNATLLGELATSARGVGLISGTCLTRRERQVALALADGLTNKEIAQQLCITLPTVKSHVHCILRKLGVGRRDEVLARLRDSAAI